MQKKCAKEKKRNWIPTMNMLRPAQNLVRALQGHNHKVSKIKHPFQVEPIESMGLVYLPTFTMKINQVQVNIPYMDGMGKGRKPLKSNTMSQVTQKSSLKKSARTDSGYRNYLQLLNTMMRCIDLKISIRSPKYLQCAHLYNKSTRCTSWKNVSIRKSTTV